MSRKPAKLSRLLRVRQVQEEQARALWQQAEHRAREREQELAVLIASLLQSREELVELQSTDRPGLIPLHEQLERHLSRSIRLASREAECAREEASTAREPWHLLRTRAEGLKKLVGRAQTEHRQELDQRQEREQDEVAGRRARPMNSPSQNT
ncbi:MAG: flagellar export protein FliJ [Planctomycetota bacterium]|jgi:flagellar export protein FliJ